MAMSVAAHNELDSATLVPLLLINTSAPYTPRCVSLLCMLSSGCEVATWALHGPEAEGHIDTEEPLMCRYRWLRPIQIRSPLLSSGLLQP